MHVPGPRSPAPAALLLSSALLIGSPGIAGAQTPAASFDELKPRLQPGASVVITDAAGGQVRGKVTAVSGTSLNVLSQGKPRTFAPGEVGLITSRQRDSLWNGLLIGAAAGTAPAIYWAIADPNECTGLCMDDLLVGVSVGTAIGLAVDAAMKKNVVVFRAPLTIAPVVSPRRAGVGLTISF